MDMFQLECVLAVAQYRSFTKASESKHISQPALSQIIAKVEQELGVKLFDRSTRYVYLTTPGQEFIQHALRIQQEYHTAWENMQKYQNIEQERLMVGACNTIAYYNLIDLIDSFYKQYPQIQIELYEADSIELFRMLQRSQVDVALVQMYGTIDNISHRTLANDEVVMVVSSLHRFSGQKVVSLSDAKSERFILPAQGSIICKECMQACELAGFKPNIVGQCTNIATIIELAASNFGIGLLSERIAVAYRKPEISIVHITPTIAGTISLAFRSPDFDIPKTAAFVNYSTQWLETLRYEKKTGR